MPWTGLPAGWWDNYPPETVLGSGVNGQRLTLAKVMAGDLVGFGAYVDFDGDSHPAGTPGVRQEYFQTWQWGPTGYGDFSRWADTYKNSIWQLFTALGYAGPEGQVITNLPLVAGYEWINPATNEREEVPSNFFQPGQPGGPPLPEPGPLTPETESESTTPQEPPAPTAPIPPLTNPIPTLRPAPTAPASGGIPITSGATGAPVPAGVSQTVQAVPESKPFGFLIAAALGAGAVWALFRR